MRRFASGFADIASVANSSSSRKSKLPSSCHVGRFTLWTCFPAFATSAKVFAPCRPNWVTFPGWKSNVAYPLQSIGLPFLKKVGSPPFCFTVISGKPGWLRFSTARAADAEVNRPCGPVNEREYLRPGRCGGTVRLMVTFRSFARDSTSPSVNRTLHNTQRPSCTWRSRRSPAFTPSASIGN